MARAVARVLSCCLLALLLASPPLRAEGGDGFRLRSLSTRPETVSGGDALIQVDVPAEVALADVAVTLEGRGDVTRAFRGDAAAHRLTGLVTGLALGTNTLSVFSGDDGDESAARLMLLNHPITGPVFSGPQEKPFICQTQDFKLAVGGTLGPALDASCSAKTRVDYLYTSTDGKRKPLPSRSAYPADLAFTTTMTGARVPYIVRVETGTINRAIYELAILHDPAAEAAPDPWTRPSGWNGRLVYTFGGGCTTGWYRQGANTGGVLDDLHLRQGYAVASSSLNVFGNNCSDLLAAETMMMVKERFIKAYGVPRFTIGWGCSGGSYQQHQIGDNYPGLLDGILPGCSFPEVGFATIQFITDARLLKNYFNALAPGAFSPEQQRRVTGFLNLKTMPNVSIGAGRISPIEFCPPSLPIPLRYDALTNPTGARCDVYDHTVNVYGRDLANGFARRPLDNVGIQYGLGAVNDEVISVDQFLDLNERVGGFDVDGNFRAARSVADRLSMRAAYQTGRLTNGGAGLRTMPIIDYRAYNDDAPDGDIHLRYHSFSMRARLLRANGTADNQIMLVEDSRHGLYSSASPVLAEALRQMDRWLDNLSAGRGGAEDDDDADERARAVINTKPPGLVDACWTRDAVPRKIEEPQLRVGTTCSALYPPAPAPREVAGASVASDVIKCQLKTIGPRRLPDRVHARAAGQALAHLPERRLRLVEARHRAAAAARHLDRLRRVGADRRPGAGVGRLRPLDAKVFRSVPRRVLTFH